MVSNGEPILYSTEKHWSTFLFAKITTSGAVPLTCHAGFILIASGIRMLAWLNKKSYEVTKRRKSSKNPMKCNVSLYKVQWREFTSDLFATI